MRPWKSCEKLEAHIGHVWGVRPFIRTVSVCKGETAVEQMAGSFPHRKLKWACSSEPPCLPPNLNPKAHSDPRIMIPKAIFPSVPK